MLAAVVQITAPYDVDVSTLEEISVLDGRDLNHG